MQLAAQQARIEQLQALAELRRDKLAQLGVRAGLTGVLQLMEGEVGQLVAPGDVLARVSDSRTAQGGAQDSGDPGERCGCRPSGGGRHAERRRPGTGSRIDPAALEGTVLVDIELHGELPRGTRPDLSVDGRIELERLENVLRVGRPIHARADSAIGLFRLEPDGVPAVRVQVQIGSTSVNTIGIRGGLAAGDQVVLSDMSAWNAHDRIRLDWPRRKPNWT